MLEPRRLPSTFTVTSVADDGSTGTLRWAVLSADSAGGSNTVAFDPTVFDTPRSILLVGGELVLTSGNVTIDGPGAGLLTVNGGVLRQGLPDRLGGDGVDFRVDDHGRKRTTGGGLYDRGTRPWFTARSAITTRRTGGDSTATTS